MAGGDLFSLKRRRRTWTEVGRWATGEGAEAEGVEAAVLAAAEQQCQEDGMLRGAWGRQGSADLGPWKSSSEYTKFGGHGTVQLYKCPLAHRCGCKCMLRVMRYPRMVVMDMSGPHQHGEDRSKGLKLQEVAAIVKGVRADPFLRPAEALRQLTKKEAGLRLQEGLLKRGLYIASKARREALADMFTRKHLQPARTVQTVPQESAALLAARDALPESEEAEVGREAELEIVEEANTRRPERLPRLSDDSPLDVGAVPSSCGAGAVPSVCGAGCLPGFSLQGKGVAKSAQLNPVLFKAEAAEVVSLDCRVVHPCPSIGESILGPLTALQQALSALRRARKGPHLGGEFDAIPDRDKDPQRHKRHKRRKLQVPGDVGRDAAPPTSCHCGTAASGAACKVEDA
jgi:hypothetical protein